MPPGFSSTSRCLLRVKEAEVLGGGLGRLGDCWEDTGGWGQSREVSGKNGRGSSDLEGPAARPGSVLGPTK